MLEDIARFVLDDKPLVEELKSMRHALCRALPECVTSRDTPGDVGTDLTHELEASRADLASLVHANANRFTEAARALEEALKLQHPDAAAVCKQLRYRGYEVHRLMLTRLPQHAPHLWRLMVLLTESLCHHDIWDVAKACIESGVDVIQIREKEMAGKELLQRTEKLIAMARPAGVAVIVNDRPDIALAAGADGVHLGQSDLPCQDVRRLAGERLIVGVSTSHIEQAAQAAADGADYCGVGPMFSSTTKHKDHIAGPDYLRTYQAKPPRPGFAIGGIKPSNLPILVEAGVQRIAVSSCVLQSDEPGAVVQQLLEMLPEVDSAVN